MVKSAWVGPAVSAGLLALILGAGPSRAQPLDRAAFDDRAIARELLAELNLARVQPAAYAELLSREAAQAAATDANSESITGGESETDPDAFQEAVAFLKRQPPLPPLDIDPGLTAAALAHTAYQGAAGGVGHEDEGEESLDQRMHRNGVFANAMAEDISYGYVKARDVVRQLIVDSGVPDRGHRTIMFDGHYRAAGIACGPHKLYGSMCVIDFIGASHRPGPPPARALISRNR